MPPDPPPQRGTAFAHSKYAPVTLYYSPATTALNENPVTVHTMAKQLNRNISAGQLR